MRFAIYQEGTVCRKLPFSDLHLLHAKSTALRTASKLPTLGFMTVASLVHIFDSQHHRNRRAWDHSQLCDDYIYEIWWRDVVRQVKQAQWRHVLPVFKLPLPCSCHDEVIWVIWNEFIKISCRCLWLTSSHIWTYTSYLARLTRRNPSAPSHRTCRSHNTPAQVRWRLLQPEQSEMSPHET